MSGEPKSLAQMTPEETWELAWGQAIDACREFDEESAAKKLEAVRSISRQLLGQGGEGAPVVARDEATELRAVLAEAVAFFERSIKPPRTIGRLPKQQRAWLRRARRLVGGESA